MKNSMENMHTDVRVVRVLNEKVAGKYSHEGGNELTLLITIIINK